MLGVLGSDLEREGWTTISQLDAFVRSGTSPRRLVQSILTTQLEWLNRARLGVGHICGMAEILRTTMTLPAQVYITDSGRLPLTLLQLLGV